MWHHLKKYLKIGSIIGVLLAVTLSALFMPTRNVDTHSGNLASKYCLEHGGSSFIQENTAINGTKTSEGICEFPNGPQCEEWKYFRGECEPT